jgi:peptidoglycan/LPS O-acetylase OafA/YrhL
MEVSQRLISLDILRAVAVILVLGRHMNYLPIYPADLAQMNLAFSAAQVWSRGGWIGVDLFFVLSGFLVSSLLFREHKRYGRIRFGHFVLRRGLKIYPAFYFLIAATTFLLWARGYDYIGAATFYEIFFLQNYGVKLWDHTWTLAIEEHFYLLLPLLLIGLGKIGGRRPDPFRAVPAVFLLLAVGLLALRLANAIANPFIDRTHLFPTHLRIDSLMFGVLLSFLFNYRQEAFLTFCRRHLLLLACGGIALLVPAFIFDLETFFIYTAGLTCFYLGSGMLLAAAVASEIPLNGATRALGYLGAYSYSIYLWHMPMLKWGLPVLQRTLNVQFGVWGSVAIYMVGSLMLGVVLARVIEVPILRLRDRLLPSRSKPLPVGN